MDQLERNFRTGVQKLEVPSSILSNRGDSRTLHILP